jgi:hypothetical protein
MEHLLTRKFRMCSILPLGLLQPALVVEALSVYHTGGSGALHLECLIIRYFYLFRSIQPFLYRMPNSCETLKLTSVLVATDRLYTSYTSFESLVIHRINL